MVTTWNTPWINRWCRCVASVQVLKSDDGSSGSFNTRSSVRHRLSSTSREARPRHSRRVSGVTWRNEATRRLRVVAWQFVLLLRAVSWKPETHKILWGFLPGLYLNLNPNGMFIRSLYCAALWLCSACLKTIVFYQTHRYWSRWNLVLLNLLSFPLISLSFSLSLFLSLPHTHTLNYLESTIFSLKVTQKCICYWRRLVRLQQFISVYPLLKTAAVSCLKMCQTVFGTSCVIIQHTKKKKSVKLFQTFCCCVHVFPRLYFCLLQRFLSALVFIYMQGASACVFVLIVFAVERFVKRTMHNSLIRGSLAPSLVKPIRAAAWTCPSLHCSVIHNVVRAWVSACALPTSVNEVCFYVFIVVSE